MQTLLRSLAVLSTNVGN